jgi:hypothetical protein
MVDSATVKTASKLKKIGLALIPKKEKKVILEPPVPPKLKITPEEKVEVLIKEIIRINPRDFSAFKHALEEFVESWDK